MSRVEDRYPRSRTRQLSIGDGRCSVRAEVEGCMDCATGALIVNVIFLFLLEFLRLYLLFQRPIRIFQILKVVGAEVSY